MCVYASERTRDTTLAVKSRGDRHLFTKIRDSNLVSNTFLRPYIILYIIYRRTPSAPSTTCPVADIVCPTLKRRFWYLVYVIIYTHPNSVWFLETDQTKISVFSQSIYAYNALSIDSSTRNIYYYFILTLYINYIGNRNHS